MLLNAKVFFMSYADEELSKVEFKVDALVGEVLRKEKVILNLQEDLENTGMELIQVQRELADTVEALGLNL